MPGVEKRSSKSHDLCPEVIEAGARLNGINGSIDRLNTLVSRHLEVTEAGQTAFEARVLHVLEQQYAEFRNEITTVKTALEKKADRETVTSQLRELRVDVEAIRDKVLLAAALTVLVQVIAAVFK